MSTAGLNQFWELIGGVFRFNAEVFQQISTLPNGLTLALFVVLAAGLSLEVGQSIILFINRVKPIRFIFSLLISALLYVTQVASYKNACSRVKAKIKAESLSRNPSKVTA